MAGGDRSNARAVAVASLAGGLTQAEAARRAGIGERTLRRWLKRPDFKEQVDAAKAEMFSRAIGMLADASTEAAATLRQLLSALEPPSVRLRAAVAILELGIKLRESEELARRIAALEEKITTGG